MLLLWELSRCCSSNAPVVNFINIPLCNLPQLIRSFPSCVCMQLPIFDCVCTLLVLVHIRTNIIASVCDPGALSYNVTFIFVTPPDSLSFSRSPSLPPVTPPLALCAYGSCHWGRGVASRRVTGPWCLLLYVIIPPICSPQWVPHGDHEVAIVKMEAKMERGAVGGVSLHRPRKDSDGWRS